MKFWGQFSITVLVIDTFYQILLCTKTVLENLPQNRDNFLNNKIFKNLDPFLCIFIKPKTWDKLSVNWDDDFSRKKITKSIISTVRWFCLPWD